MFKVICLLAAAAAVLTGCNDCSGGGSRSAEARSSRSYGIATSREVGGMHVTFDSSVPRHLRQRITKMLPGINVTYDISRLEIVMVDRAKGSYKLSDDESFTLLLSSDLQTFEDVRAVLIESLSPPPDIAESGDRLNKWF